MLALVSRNGTESLEALRAGQKIWAATPVASRLHIVRQIRDRLAASAGTLTAAFPSHLKRTAAETLTSELIPLVESCRFLEQQAAHLLRPCRLSSTSRPWWLRGVDVEVRREPFGLVLVIGPGNYPLFLPAVQTLQALVAGNTVLLKPGRGAGLLLEQFAELAFDAGLPCNTLALFDEDIDGATRALASGVDKVVMTGSLESGRAVLRQTLPHVTPAVLELSGDDPVFVLASADLALAARAIAFGTRLNGGHTCIAPRRLFADATIAGRLREMLPADAPPLLSFTTEEEALAFAEGPYALGATVFGSPAHAYRVAARITAGVVVINDMIVPTADPRVSFGGRRASGFGKTRGAEGLLEMTVSKTIVIQKSKRLRHLEPMPAQAENLFMGYLAAAHCSRFRERLRGCQTLWRALRNREENLH